MRIGEFSVRQRVLVNLTFVGVLIVGAFTFFTMPAEMLPDVNLDEAVVVVLYPGVSPEEMETLVTKPLEEEIEAVEDVEYVASTSGESRSVIDVRFRPGLSDDEFDRRILDLRSAVDNARAKIPSDAEDPQVIPIKLGEVIPIMSVSLGGPVSDTVLREVAEDLKDRILDVEHVRSVDVVGAGQREIWIELDGERLESYGLSVGDVVASLAARNINVPAGVLDLGRSEYIVRTLAEFESLRDIADHVVASGPFGRQIRIRDVGAVRDTLAERLTFARLDGERSVMLWVTKDREGSVIDVVDQVRDVVEAYSASTTEDVAFQVRNDTSAEVREILSVLERNALLGIALVVFILFVFIGLRNAILASIGIPFSFFAAFVLMNAAGITINTVSLFSLVLVLGMLVDDAIIVIENIYRHMERGLPARDAAILGTEEVVAPVTAAVLTTVAAFLPLLLMSGIWGKFISVIPKTVTFALIASLLEAFIVLPSHMADFGRVAGNRGKRHPRFLTLTRRYERMLRLALRRRCRSVLGILALAVIALGLLFTLDITIFVEEDVDQIEIRAQTPVGTRLEVTDAVARKVEEVVFQLPEDEVEAVVTRVGFMIRNYRGELASNNIQVNVDLMDRERRSRSDSEIMEALRAELSTIPGLTFLSLSRPQQSPPSGRPVEVRVRGEDARILRRVADEVKAKLAQHPGVVDIDDDAAPGKSELHISLAQGHAALYGLTAFDVASAVRAAFEGVEATKYRGAGDEEIDIVVRLEEADRESLDDLKRLRIRTPSGALVPLGDVAEFEIAEAAAELHRRDGERVVTVTAGVEQGTTSTQVNEYLRREFDDLHRRYPGYRLEFGGEYEETQKSFASLFVSFLVAVLLIYVILGAEFQSFVQPFIIMFTVPFAFIGVVVGLVVMRYPFTLNAGIAIVALAGVVVNDSIVLVDFIKRARQRGVGRWESIVQAGCMRLRPILLTSITTILGVLPLALGWGGVSATWGPMAASLAWGLGFATVLTLFVIPALFAIVDDVKARFGRLDVSGAEQPSLRPCFVEELEGGLGAGRARATEGGE